MLGRKDYKAEELERSRTTIGEQLATYQKLSKAIAENSDSTTTKALEWFETPFFNNLLLTLDRPFVHRLRLTTGKDNNPLNEVELLCESLLNNNGVFRGNNVIKYDPETSVLGITPGETIALKAADFERLSTAFYAELEARFL
jgi:hypothetical protein